MSFSGAKLLVGDLDDVCYEETFRPLPIFTPPRERMVQNPAYPEFGGPPPEMMGDTKRDNVIRHLLFSPKTDDAQLRVAGDERHSLLHGASLNAPPTSLHRSNESFEAARQKAAATHARLAVHIEDMLRRTTDGLREVIVHDEDEVARKDGAGSPGQNIGLATSGLHSSSTYTTVALSTMSTRQLDYGHIESGKAMAISKENILKSDQSRVAGEKARLEGIDVPHSSLLELDHISFWSVSPTNSELRSRIQDQSTNEEQGLLLPCDTPCSSFSGAVSRRSNAQEALMEQTGDTSLNMNDILASPPSLSFRDSAGSGCPDDKGTHGSFGPSEERITLQEMCSLEPEGKLVDNRTKSVEPSVLETDKGTAQFYSLARSVILGPDIAHDGQPRPAVSLSCDQNAYPWAPATHAVPAQQQQQQRCMCCADGLGRVSLHKEWSAESLADLLVCVRNCSCLHNDVAGLLPSLILRASSLLDDDAEVVVIGKTEFIYIHVTISSVSVWLCTVICACIFKI